MERMNIMKEKVNVTGLPETMIQTLYARAKESGKENAKIHDDMAVEMVSRLDYDFSKADQDKAMSYGVIAWTSEHDCSKYCKWTGYKMLPNAGEICALV